MINEAEQKLVDALRSGKYEQGFNRLHTDNNFCCLGVACDVVGGGTWNAFINGQKTCYEYQMGDDVPNTHVLPIPILDQLQWLGRGGSTDIVDREKCIVELWECNDHFNLTFSQIADIIAAGLMKYQAAA